MSLPSSARSLLVASSFGFVVGGCALPAGPDDNGGRGGDVGGDVGDDVDLAAEVASFLTGRFDSSAQAATDTRYFGVQLQVCALDVPSLGAHVLYVEQAMLSALDQPYRQRVYVVDENDDGAVVSTVSELSQPEGYIGFCNWSEIDQRGIMPLPEEIHELPGCAVTLTKNDDGSFAGGTDGDACLNDHNGATYATTEVTLSEAGIASWDRGYDHTGAQVWGAVAGPYRFDRKQ